MIDNEPELLTDKIDINKTNIVTSFDYYANHLRLWRDLQSFAFSLFIYAFFFHLPLICVQCSFYSFYCRHNVF